MFPAGFDGSDIIITGTLNRGPQYHFYMETQGAVSIPTDDGITVHAGTQWQLETQQAVAKVLAMDQNQFSWILSHDKSFIIFFV